MQEVSPENENEEFASSDEAGTSPQESAAIEVVEGEMVDDEEEEEEDEAQARIAELEEENSQLKARALRVQADAENFKKRNERERAEAIKFANKNIFQQLLDVLDNFDRAMISIPDPKDNFVIGVQMIQKQLLDVLSQNGVETISAVGRLFDPYLDEALAQEPNSEFEENTIIEVFQKGYRYQGSLLRAAKVKVAANPNAPTTEGEADSDGEPEIDKEA